MSSKISKDKYYPIRKYNTYLSRQTQPIPCSFCQKQVLPKCYEKHCFSTHQRNSKIQCVWCQGKTHWPAKSRHKYGQHLLECAQKFILSPPPNSEKLLPSLVNLDLLSPQKHFFGLAKLHSLPDGAYQWIWPMELKPYPLSFQCKNLNMAASCVYTYLNTRETFDWFHVSIPAVSIPSFIENMDKDQGQTRTLPFFCWCDGGTQEKAIYRQHRHCIIASPKGHFVKHVWNPIKPYDKPEGHYTYKYKKLIESPMHFLNVIGYLSQRKSQCKESFNRTENKNHFFIFLTLPVDFKKVLVTLWDGGILDWLRETYQNMSYKDLLSTPMKRVHEKWRVAIGDLPRIPQHLIWPVTHDFIPVFRPTDYFLCLINDKKLYFDKLEVPLSEQEWIQHQMSGGNIFFHVVANELWCVRPRDQRFLNVANPMKMEISELKIKNMKLKMEISELKEHTKL